MKISSAFDGSKAIIAWIAVGLMGASLLVELIVTAYWWSYYHPFAIHYMLLVKAVYLCTLMCWIFSLVALLLLILMVVSYFFIHPIADSAVLSTIINTFYTIFAIISLLLGIICAVLGILQPKNTSIVDGKTYEYDLKCYNHLFTHSEAPFEYAVENNKGDDYFDFMLKIVKKIVKNGKDITKEDIQEMIDENSLDEYGNEISFERIMTKIGRKLSPDFNQSLCNDTGIPTLVFAILLIVGLILFAVAKCGSKGGVGNSLSENE